MTSWRHSILAWTVLVSIGGVAHAQLAPLSYDQGAVGLGLALRRLPVAARVLYVTAHPDDEHNGVLTAFSRGRGVRTALLTLTRGDGGQNALGPELFEALGVLRTEELNALHRYDGVTQFFSRAYEFGFSFSVDETVETWGHDATLGDIVRVVRAFRPDVILTLPLEAQGEHAHHLASARLTREAFRAAADPDRFPEHRQAGLRPWQARAIYQGGVGGSGRPTGAASVVVHTGQYDPLVGLTWLEWGSLGRTQHRSQSASQLKADPGPLDAAFALVDGTPPVAPNRLDGVASDPDPLEGWDTSLVGLMRLMPAREPAAERVRAGLLRVQAAAERAQGEFDAREPERSLPSLRAGLAALTELQVLLRDGAALGETRDELLPRLVEAQADWEQALRLAHVLVVEARPSDDLVIPGQGLEVHVRAWNQGVEALEIESITLDAPAGWRSEPASESEANVTGRFAPGSARKATFKVTVAGDARPSQPYFHRPPGAGRYVLDVPEDDGRPWSAAPVQALLRYRSLGLAQAMTVRVPVLQRYEARALAGEKQKELGVVPALGVRIQPAVIVLPTTPGSARDVRVTVVNFAPGPLQARVRLEPPSGFRLVPESQDLDFKLEGEERTLRFSLRGPAVARPGAFELRAFAEQGGRTYALGDQLVAYDHVQDRRLYREARARVLALDVRVAASARVGYVPGVSDDMAGALRQLGVPVTVLDADALAFGDLARFTTIVTGVRAYTDPALRASHGRLMAWVRAGGHLVVQYGRNEFNQLAGGRAVMGVSTAQATDSPFAPYPASVTTRRITDEHAPLVLLAPRDPLLRVPNLLGPDDWADWVQERGIQLLEARDARYRELLGATDTRPENPGEKRGLLVEARVGRGTWTYVGLALFRQWAAGTPGAYRLLANLISRPRGAVPSVPSVAPATPARQVESVTP